MPSLPTEVLIKIFQYALLEDVTLLGSFARSSSHFNDMVKTDEVMAAFFVGLYRYFVYTSVFFWHMSRFTPQLLFSISRLLGKRIPDGVLSMYILLRTNEHCVKQHDVCRYYGELQSLFNRYILITKISPSKYERRIMFIYEFHTFMRKSTFFIAYTDESYIVHVKRDEVEIALDICIRAGFTRDQSVDILKRWEAGYQNW